MFCSGQIFSSILLKFYFKRLSSHSLYWPPQFFTSLSPVLFPSIFLNQPLLWLCSWLCQHQNCTTSKIFTSSTPCFAYQLWCYNSTILPSYQALQSSDWATFSLSITSLLSPFPSLPGLESMIDLSVSLTDVQVRTSCQQIANFII